LNKNSKLVIFEIDRICDKYYDTIGDKRIHYIKDSAENISKHFPDEKYDYILSTLPFAIIPKKILINIFKEIKIHLKQN
jgi:phospholipid N-methyltransferase